MLRITPGKNASLSAAPGERPDMFEVWADGKVLAPEDLPVQRAARGESVYNFAEQIRFRDGTSIDVTGNAVPLRAPNGKIYGSRRRTYHSKLIEV